MRIAICDDEEWFQRRVLTILNEYAISHEDIKMTISTFANADACLKATEKYNGFDIYILDIVMPGMNGIKLGIELRENGYDGHIIYLTSSPEFALDSYKAEASDYILKPIITSDFLKAFDKAVVMTQNKTNKVILVKTRANTIKLPLNDIMYAELRKRAITYHLTNGDIIESVMIRTPFAVAIKELLEQKHFVLCGTSIAFNLHHITSVGSDHIIFKDDRKVFFSKKICRDIRSLWSDYWSSDETEL